jgi:hypothetical protein
MMLKACSPETRLTVVSNLNGIVKVILHVEIGTR